MCFVEDEIHFVCVCSKYRTERENFYLKISNKYLNFKILNTFDKFMYIMKNANHNFANFVNVIWNKALFYINEIQAAQIYVVCYYLFCNNDDLCMQLSV